MSATRLCFWEIFVTMVVYVGNHHGRPGVNELKQLAWELKKTLQ